jgi:hypothetical protein
MESFPFNLKLGKKHIMWGGFATQNSSVSRGSIILPRNRNAIQVIKELQEYCAAQIKPPPSTHKKRGYTLRSTFPIPSIDRLEEPIPCSSFILADVAIAIHLNKALSCPLNLSLSQLKVCIFYGFERRTLKTREIEDILVNLNIRFDYHQTAGLLLEMARNHVIHMEEQHTSTQRLIRVWTFPALNPIFLESSQKRKELQNYIKVMKSRFLNLEL